MSAEPKILRLARKRMEKTKVPVSGAVDKKRRKLVPAVPVRKIRLKTSHR